MGGIKGHREPQNGSSRPTEDEASGGGRWGGEPDAKGVKKIIQQRGEVTTTSADERSPQATPFEAMAMRRATRPMGHPCSAAPTHGPMHGLHTLRRAPLPLALTD